MAPAKGSLSCWALTLLLLLGHQAEAADGNQPLAPNETSPTGNALEPNQTSSHGSAPKPKSVGRGKQDDLNGRTSVYAFFDHPEASCFLLSGLFALGKWGAISFTLPSAAARDASFGSREAADEIVLTFQGDNCRIQMFVSKELRDGNQWLPLHSYAPRYVPPAGETRSVAPGQTISLAPGITVTGDPKTGGGIVDFGNFDKHGDAFSVLAATFYNDPQLKCLADQAYFSVTPSGLTLIFWTRRDTLTFLIEQQIMSGDQSQLIKFVAPTCRLTVRVVKEIKQREAWTRLAPIDF